MKKYLVMGGEVISKNDGQHHYVNARKLVELYHLDPKECLLMEEDDTIMRARSFGKNHILILRPRYDGNYTVPKINEKILRNS